VALLTWNSSYSVSVKSCDLEHQKLFSLINQLHDAMKIGRGRTVVADIVSNLETYTQTHFSAEEALMERAGYASLADHRVQHRLFCDQVAQFRRDLEAGTGDAVAVVTFLKDWLAAHILKTDKMYSAHLNSRGIQ